MSVLDVNEAPVLNMGSQITRTTPENTPSNIAGIFVTPSMVGTEIIGAMTATDQDGSGGYAGDPAPQSLVYAITDISTGCSNRVTVR